MNKKDERMNKAVEALADLIPYGHLLMTTDGVGLLERAADIIEEQREGYRTIENHAFGVDDVTLTQESVCHIDEIIRISKRNLKLTEE